MFRFAEAMVAVVAAAAAAEASVKRIMIGIRKQDGGMGQVGSSAMEI